jgi:hypothetical protein
MKNKYLQAIFSFFLISTGLSAQYSPIIKKYAYSQIITPGTIPVDTDENGNKIKHKSEPSPTYYIYVTMAKKDAIKVAELWIKGKRYSVQAEEVLETPVEAATTDISDNPKKTIMVPKTSNKVLRITPLRILTENKPGSYVKQLMSKSELVMTCTRKGKKYFTTVNKIIVLPPVAGM